MALTIDSLRNIWKKEFLPNVIKDIRIELKAKIEQVSSSIRQLMKRPDEVETSQQMLSDKYDSFTQSLQQVKKDVSCLTTWNESTEYNLSKFKWMLYSSTQDATAWNCLAFQLFPMNLRPN